MARSEPVRRGTPAPRLPARVDDEGARKADLAAIHIAKAQLGLGDDEYRDLMFTVCQVRSASLLDRTGRKRFLDHLAKCLKARGLAPARGAGKAAYNARPLSAMGRKIWSLWQQLADAGKVRERSGKALASFVKRQTGVDRLEWLTWPQEHMVLESLKGWLQRGEVPREPVKLPEAGQ